jgi:hypothetical protein
MAKNKAKYVITMLPKVTGVTEIAKAIEEVARNAAIFHDRWSIEESDKFKTGPFYALSHQ